MQLVITERTALSIKRTRSKIGPTEKVCEICRAQCCKPKSVYFNSGWVLLTWENYIALKPYHRRMVLYKPPRPTKKNKHLKYECGEVGMKLYKNKNGTLAHKCRFLSEKNKCMIQYAKPAICASHVCSDIKSRIKKAKKEFSKGVIK